MVMNSRVIAHIDMDAFFAAVEQRDDPSLQGKPVIIGADPKKGKGRGVVSTCSYEARKYGVHSAMPISAAYARCPHGIFLRGHMHKYSDVSRKIFDVLHEFTPHVEPISIDEAFLDITGCYHFYQTPYNLCLAIKERIKNDLRLTASIGIAPNKMTAKIASDYGKPDGLKEVTPETLQAFLRPLAVERLWGVGKQTRQTLNRMNIQTVGELAQCSPKVLTKDLGSHGLHLFDLANGIDDRKVEQDEIIKSVSHEHTFEVDARERAEMESILSFLSEKVSRRLRRYGLKGKTVTIKIRLSDFKTVTRARTLDERINFFEDIYQTAKNLFGEFYMSSMKIRLLGVKVSGFEDSYVQEGLFSKPNAAKRERIHQAVDLIKDKFGEQAIRRARNV